MTPGLSLGVFRSRLGSLVSLGVFRLALEELLAERGYDPQLGARPLRRAIQRMIEDALSEKILYKEFRAGEIIVVDTEDDPDKPGDKRLTFRGVEGFQPPAVVELAATGAPEIEPPVSE